MAPHAGRLAGAPSKGSLPLGADRHRTLSPAGRGVYEAQLQVNTRPHGNGSQGP